MAFLLRVDLRPFTPSMWCKDRPPTSGVFSSFDVVAQWPLIIGTVMGNTHTVSHTINEVY